MAYVIDIIDIETGAVVEHRGFLGGVVFVIPDGSLDERNVWTRIRMSQAAFAAFEAKVLTDIANLKGFWLS